MNRLESIDITSAKTVTTIPIQELSITSISLDLELQEMLEKKKKKNLGEKIVSMFLFVLKPSIFVDTLRGVIIAVMLHLTSQTECYFH